MKFFGLEIRRIKKLDASTPQPEQSVESVGETLDRWAETGKASAPRTPAPQSFRPTPTNWPSHLPTLDVTSPDAPDRRPSDEGSRAISRASYQSPYLGKMRMWLPLHVDYKLYRMLREAIPCLDTAINKLTLLLGTPEIIAEDKLKKEIEGWMSSVRVPPLQIGFTNWLSNHVDSMLWSGKAVGEVVPNNAGNDIYALTNLDTESIVYKLVPESPLDLQVAQRQMGAPEPVNLDPNWTAVSLFNPGTDPHGTSLLRSLPFVAEILMTMEAALKSTWDRFGVPTYHVNYVTPKDFSDPTGGKVGEIMGGIEENFVDAMEARKNGQVRDFFTSNIEVKIIGAEGEQLAFKEPYMAIMEQIAGRTGLPYWALGFPWGTTERMSTQMADILITTLDGMWASLLPDLYRIVNLFMLLRGLKGEFTIQRKAVNLQDLVETAKAEYMSANADRMRESTGTRLWQNGIYTQEQYGEYVLGEKFDGTVAKAMDAPTIPGPTGFGDASAGANSGNGETSGAESGQEQRAACSCGRTHEKSADSQVSFGQGEQPKDQRITDAVNGFYGDAKTAVHELREKTWQIFRLPDPDGVQRSAKARVSYTEEQYRALDRAIEIFLSRMAGSNRTREGFTATDGGDGIIQQWDRFAHALGVSRATEMTGAQAAEVLPGRNSEAVTNLLGHAFERLSDNGQLRLETDLGQIKSILEEGVEIGTNPLDISREISSRFDAYEGWEFERLARTEVAFSQNAGLLDEFRAEDVDTSQVEGDVPPWHPNCMCSVTIEKQTDDQGNETWIAVFDVASEACELCLAYAPR